MYRPITIYDIAGNLGISPATVSKALNGRHDISNTTREKVLHAASELGYRPNIHARSLKMKKSWLVGVVYGTEQVGSFEHPLFLPIINAFKERMECYGYELLFLSQTSQFKGDSLLTHAFSRKVDGLLLMNVSQRIVEALIQASPSIPTVSCDARVLSLPSILTDNITAGIQAVEYLYACGHRTIGHIAGPSDTIAQAGSERLHGYKLGLERCNLPYDEKLVVTATQWTPHAGQIAMETLLDRNVSCSALFCAADFYIMGMLNVCKKNGIKIPDDLSVIGFDDVQWTEFVSPGFTTFRQDKEELGTLAADRLMYGMENETEDTEYRVPAKLVERGSVKRIEA